MTSPRVTPWLLGTALTVACSSLASAQTAPAPAPTPAQLARYDTNKNGRWDPGDFFKYRKQPELVKPVPRQVNVRQNWDNQFEIAL